MRIHCDKTTRGSGKIYLQFSWDSRMGEWFEVRAHASTKHDDGVPCLVMPQRTCNTCIVVLAIFEVSQTLVVELVDQRHNEVVATLTKTIAPLSARMRSSLNTLRKDAGAEAIRNLDEKSRERTVDVRLDGGVFPFNPSFDIVHGSATVCGTSQEFVNEKLDLRFYDNKGIRVGDGTWVNMGETCKRLVGYENGFVRCLSFSVQVPVGFTSFACWAIHAPGSDHETARLVCLRPLDVADKRASWAEFTQSAQTDPNYNDWFHSRHRTPSYEIDIQRNARFNLEPLFSIVVPLYKTPLPYFSEMVESVLEQSYGKLELILVNASPEDENLADAVADVQSRDERIRVVPLEDNLGIVGNTYAGVAEATGDFISFFDHDDVLEPDLLFQYVKGINAYPETDLLYCDEDKLCDGTYLSPFFKPDWSPDLLCSSNYVCHMLTVRKTIVDALPPMVPGEYDGSQDHFLTLFAGERARNVYHARKVLYHWRMHSQSTAAGSGAKSYTEEAGVRAVQAHLDRCGIHAIARPSGVAPNTYHVDYVLDENPLVSIIIPNKDMVPLLNRCVESILSKSTYQNFEIVVVENNSMEEATFAFYHALEKRDARVRVVRQQTDGTFNFSKTSNHGAAYARGAYLLFLNNDTEVVSANWIERLLGPLVRSEVGIVGGKLLYPDGLIQHAGVAVHKQNAPYHIASYLSNDSLHYYCSIQLTANYSAVTGACLMVRRSLFDALKGFDEDLPVDFNDIDFCLRARKQGTLIVYEPEAILIHYESISRGEHKLPKQADLWYRSVAFMMSHWSRYYAEGDPYSNPNTESSAYHRLEWE